MTRSVSFPARPHSLLAGVSVTLLSACLFSAEPAFDGATSRAPEDSAELAAWLDRAKDFAWYDSDDAPEVPIPFWEGTTEEGVRSELRVAGIVDGAIVLQEAVENCPDSYCVAYYAARTRPDGTPEVCWVNTRLEADLAEAAGAAGVTLSTISTNDDKVDLPPDIAVAGPDEAVRAFILGRFAAGQVFCEGPPIGDEIPP